MDGHDVAARATRPGATSSAEHLACLRWCGFVKRERRHPHVFYRVADDRVLEVLGLGRALLADHAEHVAGCRRVDSDGC